MALALLKDDVNDLVDKVFIRATKYMSLLDYYNTNTDQKPTEREERFMNQFLEQTLNIMKDEEIWNYVSTEMKNRIAQFDKDYSYLSTEEIVKTVGKIKAVGRGYQNFVKKDHLDFIKGCDMLRSTADFFKKVLNTKSENKVSDEFIGSLTKSSFNVKTFLGTLGERFHLNSFSPIESMANKNRKERMMEKIPVILKSEINELV